MPCYEGEYMPNQPVFPEGSEAVTQENIKPVRIDAPRITYTKEDAAALEDYLRKFG